MKKFLILFTMLFSSFVFAEEAILISSEAKADLDGYDYTSNFEITSNSGYFKKDNLTILEPNEKGFRFMATNVPKDISTNYEVRVAYPSFLNEPNKSVGYIENVSTIKQIKLVGTTNRPYDEIILMYSKSPKGKIHEIKLPQDFNSIRSMEEFTLIFDNPLYNSNAEFSSEPILGNDTDGIYLVGFKIKTNAPSGFSKYSSYSIFYIKSVSVIFDNKFTKEQLEAKKLLKEEFNIVDNAEVSKKAKSYIAEKVRIKNTNSALKHNEDTK